MSAIQEGYKENYQTLLRAAGNGDLALADCRDRASGKPVRVLVAMSWEGNELTMVPLAQLFDGDPYEELDPPGYDLVDGKAKEVRADGDKDHTQDA